MAKSSRERAPRLGQFRESHCCYYYHYYCSSGACSTRKEARQWALKRAPRSVPCCLSSIGKVRVLRKQTARSFPKAGPIVSLALVRVGRVIIFCRNESARSLVSFRERRLHLKRLLLFFHDSSLPRRPTWRRRLTFFLPGRPPMSTWNTIICCRWLENERERGTGKKKTTNPARHVAVGSDEFTRGFPAFVGPPLSTV